MTLTQEIDRFLVEVNMSATAFGKTAVKDPRFVFDLRNGRDPKYSTVEEIRQFMADHRAELAAKAADEAA